MSREALKAAYAQFGINLQEFSIQAAVRAHLGPGPLPLSPEDEKRAMPFLAAFAGYLAPAAALFGETYDYGKRAAASARPDESDPILSAPTLSTMLALMESDNQTVDQAVRELDRLRESVGLLAHHLKSVSGQSQASIASLRGLLARHGVTDKSAHLLGG